MLYPSQLLAKPGGQPFRVFTVLLEFCNCLTGLFKHDGFIGQEVGVAIKDLVEEVAAVVSGQLGVPDQPGDLPDAHRLDGVLAVVDTETGLKVDRVLPHLSLN